MKKTVILRKAGGLLLTHVNVKSELILSSKPCTNFRGGMFITGTIVQSLVFLERRKRQGKKEF